MAGQYVLTVKLDPSQLNAQIQRIQEAFGGGTGKGGSSSGGQQSTAKSLLKLGLVAAGIGTLVKLIMKITDLVVSSSPMLKQMLNLFNNELMLMLMPIGNFIGFILQPILLVLLRNVILPFYRYFMPLAQKYGTQIGDGLARMLTGAIAFFANPVGSIKGAFDSLPGLVRAVVDTAIPIAGITDLLTHLPEVSKAFGDFSKWISGGSLKIIQDSWNSITATMGIIGKSVGGAFSTAWVDIIKFFTSAGSAVSGLLTNAWDSVTKFFGQLMSDVSGDAITAWNNVVTFFKFIGSALGNAWNWFASAVKTMTAGLISLPTFSNSASATTSPGATPKPIASTVATSGMASHPITVNVNVQGSVLSENDLKKVVSTEVQKVWIKGLKGNR